MKIVHDKRNYEGLFVIINKQRGIFYPPKWLQMSIYSEQNFNWNANSTLGETLH